MAANIEAHIIDTGEPAPRSARPLEMVQKAYAGVGASADPEGASWDYGGLQLVEPPSPYEFGELSAYLELNTWLYRCVKAIAVSTVGLGYDLVVSPGVKKDQASEEHRRALNAFFKHPNDEMTWGEVIECLVVDYATVGNGYLEVRRESRGWGRPFAVEHVPAATVRVRRDKQGFVQRRGMRTVHYRRFGNPPEVDVVSKEPDAAAHLWLFHPDDVKKPFAERRMLNELFHFKNYHPRSSYYGLPDFLPAMRAILGNIMVADHNNTFFANNAIPQFMVIIKGGVVGEETYKRLAQFFAEEIKGPKGSHKTLILHVRNDNGEPVDVEVKPLATEIRDAHFRNYRTDNAEEIRIAYGVPGRMVGLTEKGGLGGAGEGTSQQEIFKYHVIEPMRRRIEHRINSFLIKEAFGFDDWEFRFRDVDITDTGKRADYINKLVRLGVMTINEAREKMNLEPLDAAVYPLAGMPVIRDSAGGLMDLRRWPELSPQNVLPSGQVEGHTAALELDAGGQLVKSLVHLRQALEWAIAERDAA